MMRRKGVLFTRVLPVVLSILILSFALAPMQSRAVFAATGEKTGPVGLTVENRSSGYVYLWLEGPSFYYLVVKPGETKVYTVMRGEYFQTVRACGDTASSIVDVSKQTRMIMPVCGANAKQAGTSPYVVDLSKVIKIVKVTVKNEADTRMLAILTGPSTYVFTLNKGESRDYTIAKGEYTVQYFACGWYGYKNFTAYHGSSLEISCPRR